jgi:hypothetical protein
MWRSGASWRAFERWRAPWATKVDLTCISKCRRCAAHSGGDSPRVLREHKVDSEATVAEPRISGVANHDTVGEAATENNFVEGHALSRELVDLAIYQARKHS